MSLVSLVLIIPNVKTIYAQLGENDELTATIEPVSPIAPGLMPDKFDFSTSFRISRCYLNPENANCLLTISQGTLLWPTQGAPVHNVTVSDNLGHDFSPIINNETIMNPGAEVTVPPLFDYKISLFLETEGAVGFDGQNMTYWFELKVHPPVPTLLCVRLPENFTVTECTSGYTQTSEEQLMAFKWNVTQNETLDCSVRFLPFHIQPTTRSMKLTADIPTVFPISGFIRGTLEQTFETPATFSIWKIIPIFEFPVTFPYGTSNVTVETVCDGKGKCDEISKRLDRPDNSSLGHYFVDYGNKVVFVYPHPTYEGDFYEFYVQATFVYPNDRPTEIAPLEEPFWPFRYVCRLAILNVTTFGAWRLNMTGSFEVRFLLPSGTEPVPSEGEKPVLGTEQDRQVVSFVYNSPLTLPSDKWTIMFDVTSLKNFFVLQACSIVALIALLVVSKIFEPESKLARRLGLSIPVGLAFPILGTSIFQFLTLGGLNLRLFFQVLFVIELLLAVGITAITLFKYGKQDSASDTSSARAQRKMRILSREQREILLAEYKMLHDSITRRSAQLNTIDAIFLPSSIVIVIAAIEFREKIDKFFSCKAAGLLPLLATIVLITLYFIGYSTTRTNSVSWNRIHDIEQILGIKGERYVYSVVRSTWWWRVGQLMWDVLSILTLAFCMITTIVFFV